MDDEDSASDTQHSRRHRASPLSNPDEKAPKSNVIHKTSSRRSRSRRSRDEAIEERRKQSSRHRTKSYPDVSENPTSEISKGSDHIRHKKKRVRTKEGNSGRQATETPITEFLHELQDDIQDSPDSNVYRVQQSTYHGPGENDPYLTHKGRDCVYVEHYDGFSSVSRENALADQFASSADQDRRWFDLSTATALDVAIHAQKIWIPLTNFCHGILAGMALMQAILVDRLLGSNLKDATQFISFYSNFSLIFTSTFYFLVCVCLVSVFDRLDMARGEWPLLIDLLSIRPQARWVLIPIYLIGLILALAASKGDDWIHFSQYNMTKSNSSEAYISHAELDMLSSWHVLNVLRCGCVIVGWLLISTSNPPDFLLRLLEGMMSHMNVDTKNKPEAKHDIPP